MDKLSRIFNTVLFGLTGLAVAFSLVAPAQLQDFNPVTEPADTITCSVTEAQAADPNFILRRSLSENESIFYGQLYGEELNIENICINLYTTAPGNNMAADVLDGDLNDIQIYGEQHYSVDYTQEQDPFIYGILPYELTHLWQHQNGTKDHTPDSIASAEYDTLYSHSDLGRYSDAQQRAIVSDYARFIFHPTGHTAQLKSYGAENCDAQQYLRLAVENEFQGAQELRYAHQNRLLTDSEKALVVGIFGNQINRVDELGVRLREVCRDGAAASVFSNSLTEFHAWTDQYHEDDYTQGDLFNYGLFTHEFTHVWQNQHNNRVVGGFDTEYDYPIDTSRWEFTDYHVEQQGSIIEDYTRYFLSHHKDTRRLLHTQENLIGLRQVVEDQFPMAQKTREYFEQYGTLPSLDTVNSWLNVPLASSSIAPPILWAPS